MFRLQMSIKNVVEKSFGGLATRFQRSMTTFESEQQTEQFRARPGNFVGYVSGFWI